MLSRTILEIRPSLYLVWANWNPSQFWKVFFLIHDQPVAVRCCASPNICHFATCIASSFCQPSYADRHLVWSEGGLHYIYRDVVSTQEFLYPRLSIVFLFPVQKSNLALFTLPSQRNYSDIDVVKHDSLLSYSLSKANQNPICQATRSI